MNAAVTLPEAPLVAITGASGFIGRALAAHLAATGARVRGLSRSALPLDSVVGDIRDPSAVRSLVAGAGVVVHLAAYVHRVNNDRECWSVNVDGTRVLVDAVADRAPNAVLIFVSSSNVYGDHEQARDERAPCDPVTAYGRSKLEAERIILSAVESGRVRGCVLRPAVVFGPRAPGNLARLIRMVKTRLVVEIDRGRQRKSLLPIASMVEAIVAVAEARDRVNGEILNVTGGPPLTIHEIIDTIATALRRKPLRLSVPYGIARRLLPRRFRRLLSVYASSSVLDDTKLRTLTRFRPPIAIRDALAAAAVDQ